MKIVDHIDNNTMIDRLTVRQRREFALWCAERVRHLMTDSRSTNALDVAARHLRGKATDGELTEARAAAWAAEAAARTASWAARAAEAAAWAAAGAAEAAAWAAKGAAGAAERAAQRAELERMLGKKINPASSKKKGRKK